MTGLLQYMTGEELLLLRIAEGEAIADAVDEELDRRALQATATSRSAEAQRTLVSNPPAARLAA
ncbi:MAG: hypothetical protein ACP5HU_11910 [Phycisphaerae bacterium]